MSCLSDMRGRDDPEVRCGEGLNLPESVAPKPSLSVAAYKASDPQDAPAIGVRMRTVETP